jgi:hypothetical protein
MNMHLHATDFRIYGMRVWLEQPEDGRPYNNEFIRSAQEALCHMAETLCLPGVENPRIKGYKVRVAELEAERDEARQMHKERVFWERAALIEQIDHLDGKLTKLRIAVQALRMIKDPGGHDRDCVYTGGGPCDCGANELRKALAISLL